MGSIPTYKVRRIGQDHVHFINQDDFDPRIFELVDPPTADGIPSAPAPVDPAPEAPAAPAPEEPASAPVAAIEFTKTSHANLKPIVLAVAEADDLEQIERWRAEEDSQHHTPRTSVLDLLDVAKRRIVKARNAAAKE